MCFGNQIPFTLALLPDDDDHDDHYDGDHVDHYDDDHDHYDDDIAHK